MAASPAERGLGRGVGLRVAAALVAILVLAWLAVMERDQRLQSSAVKLAAGGHVSKAETNLRRARFLNPDTEPDLIRSLLYAGAGHPGRAVALMKSVLRREPDNLAAWNRLLFITRDTDVATAQHAYDQLHRLDPLDVKR